MNYLVYVEHAAENLQFYLWFKNYEKRFAEAKGSDIALAPEWTQAMEDEVVAKVRKEQVDKMRREPAATAAIFKGTDFEKQPCDKKANPFNTPPRSPNGVSEDHDTLTTSWEVMTSGGMSNAQSTSNASSRTQAAEAFVTAGARLPCKSRGDKLSAYEMKVVADHSSRSCSHHSAVSSGDQSHNNKLPHGRCSTAA